MNPKAQLVVGPLLRYTGTENATLWMETDAATEVEVLALRNPLTPLQRATIRLSGSKLAAGGPPTRSMVRNRGTRGAVAFHACPTFENSIGELELDERTARVRIRGASDEAGEPRLRSRHDVSL